MPQAAGMAQGHRAAVKQCSLGPRFRLGSGMQDLGRKNQLLSLPAPACLCPRQGLKCPGWGAASAGTWLVLAARCHQRPWDVASATRGPDASADSRRQQTPRSPSVTALIAASWPWGSFGFHLPEIKVELKARGAGSLGETHQPWQCPCRSRLPSALQCCPTSRPSRLGVPELPPECFPRLWLRRGTLGG